MAITAPSQTEPGFRGPETSQLEAWLDYQRAFLNDVERNVLRTCAASREITQRSELDPQARGADDGYVVDLRWILVHKIEEYTRHNAHADPLRE